MSNVFRVIGSWMLQSYLDAGWEIFTCRRARLPGINREYDEYTVTWPSSDPPKEPDPSTFQEPMFQDAPAKPPRK